MGSGCAIGTVTSAAAGCRDMALPSLTKDPKLERAVRMQDGPAVVIGAELLQYAGDVDVRSAATGAFERGGARLPIPGDGGAGRRVRRAQRGFFVLGLGSAVAFRASPLPAPGTGRGSVGSECPDLDRKSTRLNSSH